MDARQTYTIMVAALMNARTTQSQVMRSYFAHKARFWHGYRVRAGFTQYQGRD